MDHFGIGAALAANARVYFQSARRTGRTLSLVNSLKDGDRVVFTSEREGRRVKKLCAERGVTIEIVVCAPCKPERLFSRPSPSSDARLIFDHIWVEEFYLQTLQCAADDIDKLQKELSGRGAAHRENERRAAEFYNYTTNIDQMEQSR